MKQWPRPLIRRGVRLIPSPSLSRRERDQSLLRRLGGAPSVRFVVLGAILFAIERGWSRLAPAPRATVVLTAEQLDRLRGAWTDEHGRAPDRAEDRRIVADAADDEILRREAIALGLDRADRSVRARLVQLADFLGLAAGGDATDLERAARSLGLAESDPAIAVHLADMVRLALAHTDRSDLPDAAELRAYYERNASRFAEPERIRFTHVFFGRDRRGGGFENAAIALREELRDDEVRPGDAIRFGDPFAHGSDIGPSSIADIARLFGASFAAAIEAAPLRQWAGPLASAYGDHVVWVHERLASRLPDLDTVRSRVVHALLRERAEARLRERMKEVRARYRVETPS